MCAQGAFRGKECTLGAHDRSVAPSQGLSAGEGLLGLQARDGVKVAQDRGELLGGPRLTAVAATVAVAGEAEAAARLVLGDREVPGGRGGGAGAGLGAQGPAPAGGDGPA